MYPAALRFGENDPIVQIEYDPTRQLLYTRSDNGSIYVYDLAEDGQGQTQQLENYWPIARLNIMVVSLCCNLSHGYHELQIIRNFKWAPTSFVDKI